MFEPCHLEISRSALSQNIDYMRSLIGDEVVFTSVIKGNAYGHGIEHLLPLAEECGVRSFAVYSADEALRAFNCRKEEDTRIMIMGMVEDDAIEWAVEQGVSFYVFDNDRLNQAIEASKKVGRKALIHIQLETGFHRTGFEDEELDNAIDLILDNEKYLQVAGICTHYVGAESVSNYVRIQKQISRFHDMKQRIENKGINPNYLHTACSAAVMNYPETIMDMVRVGIAQYGFWPNEETFIKKFKEKVENPEVNLQQKITDPLKRLISWKSSVMNIKKVSPGEFVGYGTSYFTERTETLAGVPVGYAHGFSRNLSNVGHVLIKGEKVPVVGLVNMNVLMVDITDIREEVHKGDEVVLIGEQGEESVSVASFSEMSNHLNYELLTRLPEDIPRYIID